MLDINQIIEAFSAMGIQVQAPSQQDMMEDFMVEDMNEPIYWNDRKVMPAPGRKSPLWEPLLHVDETATTYTEPKNAFDGQIRSEFMV